MKGGCATGKQRYRDERSALVVLVGHRFRRAVGGGANRHEDRAYRCHLCKGWHLTSKPYRPKEGVA